MAGLVNAWFLFFQIGRSTAIALARAGWNVVVTGRRAEQLQETVELIDEATGRRGAGRLVQGDICQEAVVAECVHSCFYPNSKSC